MPVLCVCVNVHLAFDVSWADPPENLHYTTDLEKSVILRWSPPQPETEDLRYQVRLFSSEQSDWKVLLNCTDCENTNRKTAYVSKWLWPSVWAVTHVTVLS